MQNPTTEITGWMGDPSRGAAMGRPRGLLTASQMPPKSVYLAKTKLDSGGYDPGGAYWGFPDNLYCAYGSTFDDDYIEYVRADSRAEAATKLGLGEQLVKKIKEK